jgi:hypothetical protein
MPTLYRYPCNPKPPDQSHFIVGPPKDVPSSTTPSHKPLRETAWYNTNIYWLDYEKDPPQTIWLDQGPPWANYGNGLVINTILRYLKLTYSVPPDWDVSTKPPYAFATIKVYRTAHPVGAYQQIPPMTGYLIQTLAPTLYGQTYSIDLRPHAAWQILFRHITPRMWTNEGMPAYIYSSTCKWELSATPL